MAVSLAFALFSALQMLKTREMGAFLHTGFSTFIQGAIGTILSFIAVLVVGGEWGAIGPRQVVIYLIYGVMAWANQEAMAQALKVVRQGTVASSICLAILAAFIADVMYFHKELLVQDMGGAALVIFFTGLQMHFSGNEIENPCLEQKQKTYLKQKDEAMEAILGLSESRESNLCSTGSGSGP